MTAPVWTLAAITGWSTWAPRQEIAPKTWAEGEVLAISGNGNAAEHGAWVRQVDGLRGGQWYRFTAAYRAEGVPYENRQVAARLEWCDARGRRTGQPDYAYEAAREGDWKRLRLDVPAPEKAMSAKVQLFLSNAPKGIVRWKDVKIEEISDPGPRNVSVASCGESNFSSCTRARSRRRAVRSSGASAISISVTRCFASSSGFVHW